MITSGIKLLMIIYFLSGLGADERAFQKIKLPAGYEIRHIPWEPVKGDETIETYARRLSVSIDNSKPFMLAGLSFGGIIASEISKFLKPEKLILFSSVMTRQELPRIYRMAGKPNFERLLPNSFLSLSRPLLYWFLSPLDQESRRLIAAFLKRKDPVFSRWALGQISRWQNEEIFEPHLHIHGGRDRIFPASLTQADYVIQGGGHFSVITHAEEVNLLLKRELELNQPQIQNAGI